MVSYVLIRDRSCDTYDENHRWIDEMEKYLTDPIFYFAFFMTLAYGIIIRVIFDRKPGIIETAFMGIIISYGILKISGVL